MKQRYAVVVLFAMIVLSSLVSFTSYRTTKEQVTQDLNQALAKALDEQQSDLISADTIRVFNSHLQIEELKGRAVLAVDTQKGFCPRPQVSTATSFRCLTNDLLWRFGRWLYYGGSSACINTGEPCRWGCMADWPCKRDISLM